MANNVILCNIYSITHIIIIGKQNDKKKSENILKKQLTKGGFKELKFMCNYGAEIVENKGFLRCFLGCFFVILCITTKWCKM